MIYRLQNPELMAKRYMTLASIVKRQVPECSDNLAPENIIYESEEEDESSQSTQ